VTTRVRDWATVDFYGVLGVDADATDAQIAQAFRARAKRVHPDATGDHTATDDFKVLAAAYTVLSDHRRRRDYDRVRGETEALPSSGRPIPVRRATSTAKPRREWTRRKARWALYGGIVLALIGLIAGVWTWQLHDASARQRSHYIPVVAHRLNDGAGIVFATRSGEEIKTAEPHQRGEGDGVGATVNVRYDPANPQHVIVDAGTFGRDITLAIVALKFFIAGIILAVFGARALGRLNAAGAR
jgi:hypothetical protein